MVPLRCHLQGFSALRTAKGDSATRVCLERGRPRSWLDGPTRYTVVHSRTVAVLFVDIRLVDAIAFRHDVLDAADVAGCFKLPAAADGPVGPPHYS